MKHDHPTRNLILFYGQSWLNKNNNNERLLTSNPYPNNAFMFDGRASLFGWSAAVPDYKFLNLVPAADIRPRAQSVITPFLFTYVARHTKSGKALIYVGHSEAQNGASIQCLLPSDHAAASGNSLAYINLISAVEAHAMLAHKVGENAVVSYVVWAQGAKKSFDICAAV